MLVVSTPFDCMLQLKSVCRPLARDVGRKLMTSLTHFAVFEIMKEFVEIVSIPNRRRELERHLYPSAADPEALLKYAAMRTTACIRWVSNVCRCWNA